MDRSLLAPRVASSALPLDERLNAEHSNFLMGQLEYHLKEFRNGVRLLQHCWSGRESAKHSGDWSYDPDRDHDSWVFTAARAAAMEVFHFWVILRALRSRVGRCASIKHLIDDAALKQAVQLLESGFDPIDLRRHAISHASEMVRNPEDFQRNYPSDTGDWLITSLDTDHMFKLKHEGQKITIAVTDESIAKLERIARLTFDAIRPASDWTFRPR